MSDVLLFGGGVQSHAILALIALGRLKKPKHILMADTGRESRLTWDYIHAHTRPLLGTLGLSLEISSHELATVDLYSGKKGDKLLLPAYTESGRLSTFCSSEWKKNVTNRYLRSIGYGPANPVRLWFGMSLDEYHRMRVSAVQWQSLYYPLIFDVPLRRGGCKRIISEVGLPVPPKSACWCCPQRSNSEWQALPPEEFQKAAALERELHAKDKRGGVWFHRSRVFLDEIDFSVEEKNNEQLELEWCTESCWT